jgi:hypothetical protein
MKSGGHRAETGGTASGFTGFVTVLLRGLLVMKLAHENTI